MQVEYDGIRSVTNDRTRFELPPVFIADHGNEWHTHDGCSLQCWNHCIDLAQTVSARKNTGTDVRWEFATSSHENTLGIQYTEKQAQEIQNSIEGENELNHVYMLYRRRRKVGAEKKERGPASRKNSSFDGRWRYPQSLMPWLPSLPSSPPCAASSIASLQRHPRCHLR